MRNGEGPTIARAENSARLVFRPTDQGDFHAAVAASPIRRIALSPFRIRLLDSGSCLKRPAPFALPTLGDLVSRNKDSPSYL
jgi:hypothetical protein